MTASSVLPSFPTFNDVDGNPLESGFIYIGLPNLNPEVAPKQAFFDKELTIPAPQPIRTIGGYPSRNGTPTQLYVDGDFSLTVRDKNGALIYNAATESLRFSPFASGIYDFDDVATLLADTSSGFGAGSIWRTRSEGFSYEEAPTSATDQHVTTAGGVKLFVQRGPNGYDLRAFSGTFAQRLPTAFRAAAGDTVYIASQETLSSTITLSVPQEYNLVFAPGAKITKTGGGGLRFQPDEIFDGSVTADQTNRAEVLVAGAGWTIDEHKDRWVQIISPYNGENRSQRIQIVSNTSDTLTLKFETGVQALAGQNLKIYPFLPKVEIHGLNIDGAGFGTPGIFIQYANQVVLHDPKSINNSTTSNAITINSCGETRSFFGRTENSQMGFFIYNSGPGIIFGHVSKNASFQHTVQFKDCREMDFVQCRSYAGPASNGTDGIAARTSGLHRSYDCRAIECYSEGFGSQGAIVYSLPVEGERHGVATGFEIINQRSVRCNTGAEIRADNPGPVADVGLRSPKIVGGTMTECQTGWRVNGIVGDAPAEVRGVTAERSLLRGGFIDESEDALVFNPVFVDTGFDNGSATSEHLRISASTGSFIQNPVFSGKLTGINVSRCVRETGGASANNEVRDPVIIDDVGTLTGDVVWLSPTSRMVSSVPRSGRNTLSRTEIQTRQLTTVPLIENETLTGNITYSMWDVENGSFKWDGAILQIIADGGNRRVDLDRWSPSTPIGFTITVLKLDPNNDLTIRLNRSGNVFADGTTQKVISSGNVGGFILTKLFQGAGDNCIVGARAVT